MSALLVMASMHVSACHSNPGQGPAPEDLGLLSDKCSRYGGRVGPRAVLATAWSIQALLHPSALLAKLRTVSMRDRSIGARGTVAHKDSPRPHGLSGSVLRRTGRSSLLADGSGLIDGDEPGSGPDPKVLSGCTSRVVSTLLGEQ